MKRETIDFDSFKQHFIEAQWGYFPVCSAITENEKSVEIDLICEWRLSDGKIKFVVVPFETKDQLAQIVAWLFSGAEILKKEIDRHIVEHVVVESKNLNWQNEN